MASLIDILTESDFKSLQDSNPRSTLHVLNFHAPWAAPCVQMRSILTSLAATYPTSTPATVTFANINAEDLPDISEDYDVTAVPYLVLLRDGKVVDTLGGSDATKVRELVERHAGKPSGGSGGRVGAGGQNGATTPATLPPAQKVDASSSPATTNKNVSAYAPTLPSASSTVENGGGATGAAAESAAPTTEASQEALHARLTNLVRAASVMLFMKGTPSGPQCGFSRQLVALLRERGIRYGFFNILADEEVRQGLKTFADWPTFPQLWVDGELIGGLDIVKEEFGNDPTFLDRYAVKPTTPVTTTDDGTQASTTTAATTISA
ncbi:MAG: hypothetical protein M1825_002285 [Sarcosagium campestre]|nr:MAG: hypothetical protein M1825_002285 [Sarcosagium campestre]